VDSRQREGERPQWLKVSVWGERAQELLGKVKSGAPCYVEGTLRLRHWTAAGGRSGTSLELTASRCETLFRFPVPVPPDSDADPEPPSGFDENGDLPL
jgi:single-stranded DNA-binding protein